MAKGVAIVDTDRKTLHVNSTWCDITGYAVGDVVGRADRCPFRLLAGPATDDLALRAIDQAIAATANKRKTPKERPNSSRLPGRVEARFARRKPPPDAMAALPAAACALVGRSQPRISRNSPPWVKENGLP